MSQLEQFTAEPKLAAHKDWVSDYAKNKSNYPISLEVDPTNFCPLKCGYCIWGSFRADMKKSLRPETLIRIVDEAADIGVKGIVWTGGGDPLANPGTVPAIEHATAKGIKNGMFTTGVPMTPEKSAALVRNLSWVRFHVDGATPETYGKVHQVHPSFFDKATRNIRDFTDKRKETGSTTTAGIGTVALEDNFAELEGLARLTKELGLDYFQYKHDLTRMTDQGYLNWWEETAVPVLNSLSAELEDSNFKLQYSRGVNYGLVDRSPRCHVRFMNTAITADGRVAYCKSTRDREEWSLGSIYDQSLREIFDGQKSRELASQVTPETCGITPCPLKQANLTIAQIVEQDDLSLLPVLSGPIKHQEFL